MNAVNARHAAGGETALWPRDAGWREETTAAPWAWLAGLTLLAALLRAIALDQQLWYDEITTLLDSVRLPFSTILTSYASQNQHTLYSLLARASILLLGDHPWTLRLPAVLFGVFSVPALYFFARELLSRREALLTSALLAVSYHHVWFSQNARGYTALAFWTLLASTLFLRGARESSPRAWAAYGVVTALGMYTHLTMAFVAAAHAILYVCLLVDARRQSPFPRRGALLALGGFAIGAVGTIVLYAPVLPQIFQRTLGQAASPVDSEWTNPLWLVLETLRGLGAGAGGWRAAAAGVALLIAGVFVLAALAGFARHNRYALGLLLLPGMVTAGALLVLGHNLWPRFFFFSIGFALLLLVHGAFVAAATAGQYVGRDAQAGHTAAGWGTALVTLMLAASAWTLPPAWLYPKQDFAGALAYVEAERRPGDVVAAVGLTSLPYRRYYGRDWPAVTTRAELDALGPSAGSTWLLYTLPVFVASRHPDVWNAIQTEFTTVRVFRGTLGGGEIHVSRSRSR